VVAVIFEVVPHMSRRQEYLEIAAELRQRLDQIEGFISIERFESLSQPGKILSLSFWSDDMAVARWRENAEHRSAQQLGRREIFQSYRIRVASVVRESSLPCNCSATERTEPTDRSTEMT
jgi:heme-degrading monooxygenase HmoA